VQTLLAAARRIEEAGITVADLAVRRPSLDDVFLTLTSAPGASGALRSVPGEATAPRPRESWQATA
jgi:ABC-2 type transport system ATP-binding protein